jgi:uncharacterized membrane protein YdjX (TVP38/TMEM64 family)
METPATQSPEPGNNSPIGWKPLLFAVAAIALVMAYSYFRRDLSLHALAHREDALRQYQAEHPLRLPLIVLAVFVGAAGISLPYATVILSLGCGWLFGMAEAAVLASFATTAGATIAFWISRYLLRDSVSHHFAHLMVSVDELLARDGPFYLLSLRLVHVIPSWLINLLMGWTTIRTWTFWWATQLGTLPATIFYVCVGQQFKFTSLHDLADKGGISSLLTPGHVAVFVLFAAVPLIARQVIMGARGQKSADGGQESGSRDQGTQNDDGPHAADESQRRKL